MVESQLHTRLRETLNTEIQQQVVTDIGDAINWLKTTFYYVRVQRAPAYYGL